MATPRNRLPTLIEVLSRRTLPPVDLFSFFIYMRDQQRSLDYLDFWLDVSQHLSLCRHFVREMRRSVLVATPDLDTPHASSHLDHYPDLDGAGSEKDADQRLSAFLRSETPEPASGMRRSFGDTLDTPNYSQGGEQTQSSTISHAVSRSDVRASAEKILYTYLLRGAEREIVLPDPILQSISNAIEVDGRIDPEVFEDAKDYVFQAMERDAFPGFLRSKALGNLVPSSVMLRLVIGLIAMFGGFWAAFALIFLDIEPRTQRLWLILPFTVGVYCLIAHQYSLDPIMGLAGISEYTFCNFMRVRERYIRRLLIKRSLWILALTVALVVALVCLYTFVPGKRL